MASKWLDKAKLKTGIRETKINKTDEEDLDKAQQRDFVNKSSDAIEEKIGSKLKNQTRKIDSCDYNSTLKLEISEKRSNSDSWKISSPYLKSLPNTRKNTVETLGGKNKRISYSVMRSSINMFASADESRNKAKSFDVLKNHHVGLKSKKGTNEICPIDSIHSEDYLEKSENKNAVPIRKSRRRRCYSDMSLTFEALIEINEEEENSDIKKPILNRISLSPATLGNELIHSSAISVSNPKMANVASPLTYRLADGAQIEKNGELIDQIASSSTLGKNRLSVINDQHRRPSHLLATGKEIKRSFSSMENLKTHRSAFSFDSAQDIIYKSSISGDKKNQSLDASGFSDKQRS